MHSDWPVFPYQRHLVFKAMSKDCLLVCSCTRTLVGVATSHSCVLMQYSPLADCHNHIKQYIQSTISKDGSETTGGV